MIKILGAGISGLTAAINLAKRGYEVTVYERASHVGARHHGDLQGLDNWSTKKTVPEILKTCSIRSKFFFRPVREGRLYSPSLNEVVIKMNTPMYYLITRGNEDGSLDKSLEEQAINAGVNIEFNSKVKDNNYNIIATGPRKARAFVFGLTFKTNSSDMTIGILNDTIAPKGYCYLLISEGKATLGLMTPQKKLSPKYLDEALSILRQFYDFDIVNERRFIGYGDFFITRSAKINNRIYVGEAAGFQDCCFEFGMKYAFMSGYLAAKSIIEGKDYDRLWKECFLTRMKSSLVARFIFERLGNKGYEKLLEDLKKSNNLEAVKNLYDFSLSKRLLYPFVRFLLRNRFHIHSLENSLETKHSFISS